MGIMSLFGPAKTVGTAADLLQGAGHAMKKIIFTASSDSLDINVMMIGGRRCGKTSILAAMQACFNDAVSRTSNLHFTTANKETVNVIEKKRAELKEYFSLKERCFVPDDSPTFDETTYSFNVGLKEKKGKRLRVNFIDYPGEWLSDKASDEETEHLKELMCKSHILLVVIDTPHMMEEDGIYNEFRNRCYRTTEMIRETGFVEKESMILFVPLKCERYYNEHRMVEVQKETCKVYEELIRDAKQGKCIMAVTPILTMGGAAFSRFKRDADGEVAMNGKLPQEAIYYFPDKNVKAPQPKYCEQPVFYTLAYMLRMVQKAKDNDSGPVDDLFAWFQESFLNWPSAKDYVAEIRKIRENLKKEDDGYRILEKESLLYE